MPTVNFNDVQGFIKRGYDDLRFSNILLLRIEDAGKAKRWLAALLPNISRAAVKGKELEINIAFTYLGFEALGLTKLLRTPFSREFEEGMSEESRSRLLGDYDKKTNRSRVDDWDWRDTEGPEGRQAVHIMLLVYGKQKHLVETFCSELNLCYDDHGLSQVRLLLTNELKDRREHFGFRDGLSQPFIAEFASSEKATSQANNQHNTIALGEFLLGYPNQYGKVTEVPKVKKESGGEIEFGHNGTYLVMRQLEQEVKEFWEYMEKCSRNADGTTNMEACITLAAKMVGRWPNGAPLVNSPRFNDPQDDDGKEFLFQFDKKENFGKCPLGAHIARVNPRDSLDKDLDESFRVANHHRLLRRGRSYGQPFITSMKPDELFAKANNEQEERGLHFICLNANISRQFEFVQNTWINNTKFHGLYDDADPIAGTNECSFTLPERPVSRYLTGIPAFVRVRGGGYFFMPSISALEFLAKC